MYLLLTKSFSNKHLQYQENIPQTNKHRREFEPQEHVAPQQDVLEQMDGPPLLQHEPHDQVEEMDGGDDREHQLRRSHRTVSPAERHTYDTLGQLSYHPVNAEVKLL